MAESFTYRQIQTYSTTLVPERPPELQKMEAYAQEYGFPIIGPAAGHFCYLQARMISAQRIFELGSGYGYSTAWFARAVHENGGGTVYHTVWDSNLSQTARRHLFNDIDKTGYPDSLPVIAEKLRSGGLLIIDNMFYGGAVFDANQTNPAVAGVREFTRLITADSNWIVSLVPIRDGLIVAQKR